MDLTPENVEKTFAACLRESGEVIEGISMSAYMDAEGCSEDIASMLNQLSDKFHVGKGGGFSFLAACETATGEQWTGMHQMMDKLFMLGFAAKMAHFSAPRETWSIMPGGMPYITVNTEAA